MALPCNHGACPRAGRSGLGLPGRAARDAWAPCYLGMGLGTPAPTGSMPSPPPGPGSASGPHRSSRGGGRYLDPVHRVMNDGGLRLLQRKEGGSERRGRGRPAEPRSRGEGRDGGGGAAMKQTRHPGMPRPRRRAWPGRGEAAGVEPGLEGGAGCGGRGCRGPGRGGCEAPRDFPCWAWTPTRPGRPWANPAFPGRHMGPGGRAGRGISENRWTSNPAPTA